MKKLLPFLLLFFVNAKAAELAKSIVYDPLDVPVVNVAAKNPLMIQLPSGQEITLVSIGDNAIFSKRTVNNRDLSVANIIEFIPLKDAGESVVKILTRAGQIYAFNLVISPANSTTLLYVQKDLSDNNFYASASFGGNLAALSAAQDYLRKIPNLNIADVSYPFDRYAGSKLLLPIAVFETKHFTYFRYSAKDNLDDVSVLPVIYKVVDGYDMPVPQKVEGGFIIVETRADRFTVRAGASYSCIAKGTGSSQSSRYSNYASH